MRQPAAPISSHPGLSVFHDVQESREDKLPARDVDVSQLALLGVLTPSKHGLQKFWTLPPPACRGLLRAVVLLGDAPPD